MSIMYRIVSHILLVVILLGCQQPVSVKEPVHKKMEVTASAFNNVGYQTDGQSSRAAWGDILKDSMKVIAVSRDLLDSGLTHNTKVYIKELDDYYTVKDKMHYRWRKKIDVFMGKDIGAAKRFGVQKVTIIWGF